ncbi:hypothetical protein V8D89_007032 [Ganoderma adspersum]
MLDLTQIHDETWLDATYWPSDGPATVTVHFTGSAVYVFNIVPNTLPADTFTNISFSIDGGDVTVFTHPPDPSNTILYKHLVYQSTFNHGPHTLVMTPANSSLILFDYLIYTTLSNDDTTPPPDTSSTNSPTSTSLPNNTPQPSSSNTPTSTTSPGGSSRPLSPSSRTLISEHASQLLSAVQHINADSKHSYRLLGSQSPPSTPVGTIVGPVLGGVSLLLGVAAAIFFLCRRCKRPKASTQSLLSSTARRRRKNDHHHHAMDPGHDGDRGRDEASLVERMVSTTPISPLRFHDGTATHYYEEGSPRASQASTLPGPDNTRRRPSRGASITASPVTGNRSSKHRAELAWRLEALQRTRSILSSTTGASRLEADGSSGRTTETAIRDLEAEIADLRATLTALNARLGDDGGGSVELLPAYAE